MNISNRPNANEAFPNPKIPSLCYIKNVVKHPRIIIGDYTNYDDMDGANHRMDCVTTYPFYVMGGDWGSAITPVKEELPLKGDTVIGNDVWIGQNVTVMPGIHIGDERR